MKLALVVYLFVEVILTMKIILFSVLYADKYTSHTCGFVWFYETSVLRSFEDIVWCPLLTYNYDSYSEYGLLIATIVWIPIWLVPVIVGYSIGFIIAEIKWLIFKLILNY